MYLVFAVLVTIATFQVSVLGQCFSDHDDTNYADTIQSDLYKSQRSFAFSLLKSLQKKNPEDNIFCSPYSIYQALLLAYFGAGDNTQQELQKVLNLDWVKNKNHVFQAYNLEKISRVERLKDSSNTFTSANKIFVSNKVNVRECMLKFFNDELETKDFPGNPEQCRKDINYWVSNSTNGEIEEILTEGEITQQTKLVLGNAAYFKGSWESKFDPNATEKKIFHTSTEKRTLVDMMYKKGTFKTGYDDHHKVHILELPYAINKADTDKEPETSMIILLPPFIQGVNEILCNLTSESLEMMLKVTSSREIEVSLPKFILERDITLKETLKAMGIRDLFSSNANLSGISIDTALSLDESKHKAKVKVDEDGSIAAAATVMFSFRSARPLDPAKFECNRPFIFIIYDHKSKTLLFTGILRDPMLK